MQEKIQESNHIDHLRIQIDQIDIEITSLLERRLAIAKEIGSIKANEGVQVLDEKREEKVIERLIENIRNSSLTPAMLRIYEKIMDESKEVQTETTN